GARAHRRRGPHRRHRAERRVLRRRHHRDLLCGRRHDRRARGRPARARAGCAGVARLGRRRRALLRRRDRPTARRHPIGARSRALPRWPTPEETLPMRRNLLKALAASTIAAALPAYAQKPVELTFYYPVAVGGPVTKTIEQMADDIEKENPGIKVKPVYSSTYQESIVKALTAFKRGQPPHDAVLLSTDMFTLIDEDAIVPIDGLANSADDKQW